MFEYITLEITTSQYLSSKKYKLTILVTDSKEIDKTIFVFQKDIYNTTETFQAVASVTQLLTYPPFNPAEGSSYFLKDEVILYFESPQEMIDYQVLIAADIQLLVDGWLLVKDDLEETRTVTITPSS